MTEATTLDTTTLRERVLAVIRSQALDAGVDVDARTPLVGDGRVVDSMKLVELCLALEDLADELGFAFDWTSEAAMSRSRGMFRTAGALADAFVAQAGA